jgi:hypothetical protein
MSWRGKIRRLPKVHQFLHLGCGCDVEVVDRTLVGEHRWCTEHQVFATVKSRMVEP